MSREGHRHPSLSCSHTTLQGDVTSPLYWDHREDLWDSARGHIHGCDLLQGKGTKPPHPPQTNKTKGKRHEGQPGLAEGSAGFQESSPIRVAWYSGFLQPQAVATRVNCCLPGKLFRDSPPGVFNGGWSRRHPLRSTYPNSRPPGGQWRPRGLRMPCEKPRGLFGAFRHSEALCSGSGGRPPQTRGP